MVKSTRISAIDWMRGFVMIIMVLDHVSMAYNAGHISNDSAANYTVGDPLPAFEFFTRWISHICAPVFVFLAGTALAISVERKVARGIDSKGIDKDILLRGAFIALLDPTITSFFSGKLTFQVLYAIGVAMMCMAFFRRLSSTQLLVIALAWIIGGELVTAQFWFAHGQEQSIIVALLVGKYNTADLSISYAAVPWLSVMILGWVFGRYILDFGEGKIKTSPAKLLFTLGSFLIISFVAVRYFNDYGNMFLYREDFSWQQWLHVSKYPPSISFITLELGLMAIILATMMKIEQRIGTRPNGVLLVFGQTSMMFYLVHRIFLTGTATYGGLDNFTNLTNTYIITGVLLLLLYPFCLWYRGFKKKHPDSIALKYL
ncbi:heparan-alpha-glucosaminide N-acetyltransferase domain-containing protein [Colwellia asteriadis]|uniref:Heparan-alpha-glucosaminide N-acetyltransferase domain-containing protein n=1 Tax=Colwellia asteriadis TaxID=517723 RepID=A0ABP3WK12_9GAMM